MNLDEIIRRLKEASLKFDEPVVTKISYRQDPFLVLISTVLSLRTKDDVTHEASLKLFEKAKTPQEMIELGDEKIAKLIYPVGFYRTKAKNIVKISKILMEKYGGAVPHDMNELLSLPNVGRKTANLVLAKGFGIPAICVDIHVHRISNRLGIVSTKTPEDTEKTLKEVLPIKHWIDYNDLLVPFGQNVCKPISPLCSECPLRDLCKRVGVTRHR